MFFNYAVMGNLYIFLSNHKFINIYNSELTPMFVLTRDHIRNVLRFEFLKGFNAISALNTILRACRLDALCE